EPLSIYRLSRRQGFVLLWLLAGSIAITIILSRNILKRRKAEARLRDGEQRYRQLSEQFQIILDGIPDGVTLISPQMKVVWSNKGAGGCSSFIPGSGEQGDDCCKQLYGRTEICVNCPAVEVFRTGRRAEALIHAPDGRELEVKSFPLRDAERTVTHAILLASDVTEKNKLRQEAEQNSRLASLGELVAGIAHEINNPNALILLNASLLRKACSDAAPILLQHYRTHGDFPLGGLNFSEMSRELPHLLTELIEGADRIRRIVADLKDFARPDSGGLDEVVNLNQVVMTAVRLSANAIKGTTAHFSAVYEAELPAFRGNFQKIEQVVVNLLLNACQALPDRERALTLETGTDSDWQEIWLRVRDQGTGIRPEDLPHITDPFFTTKRDQGGTGLGLSVSARIVRSHGGHLEYTSQFGQGTTVMLRLPAVLRFAEELYERDDDAFPSLSHSAGG
ncbi:MAG: histidine kinase, partial [Desulfuromonadales bacterium]|nr:histidine kinase [Desulfuromonadales bacterium]